MTARRLLTAGLTAMAMQAGFTMPAAAQEAPETSVQGDSILVETVCFSSEASVDGPGAPIVQVDCNYLRFLDSLPEPVRDMFLEELGEISIPPSLWMPPEAGTSTAADDSPPETEPAKSAEQSESNYSYSGSVEDWRGLVAAYFPASEVNTALCVMAGESKGDPNADNPESTATGLMQILAGLWGPYFGVTQEELYDPETNIAIARKVWDIQGWGAWNAYWGCS